MKDFALSRPLQIGETLSQSEVENVFDTDFGYQFRGITLRAPNEGRYVILLANKGEIYDDEIGSGSQFTYEGEGVPEKGDQTETTANIALIDAVEDPIPIYLFTSEEGVDEYEYRGLVDVQNYRYVSDGERMVYRYLMEKLEIDSWEKYVETENEIIDTSDESPSLTEDHAKYTISKSKVRLSVFSRKVKEQYEYTCAACGTKRLSPSGKHEVEAAHIYPKSKGGNDDLRNGVAFCRLHHWAFDCGWFSITDDFEIVVNARSEREPPKEVREIEAKELKPPIDSKLVPHSVFLSGHRRLHGFE
jgi:putative restriction endonuclease